MANLPVRGLGTQGIITDVNPHDLPPNAFSDGSNVIFRDGAVIRAPVFKDMASVAGTSNYLSDAQEDDIAGVFNYSTSDSGAIIGVAGNDNRVYTYDNGIEANVTPTGASTTVSSGIWTSCEIAGFAVLNRATSEPYIIDPVAHTTFKKMSDGDWPSADRANAMRAYKDFILALNVTASGIKYGTMVKWSDAVQYKTNYTTGVTWTPATSNLAGSNILTDFRTDIVDGLPLGNAFIIYSTTESAIMDFTGSQSVFSFRNFYQGDGVINVNCVVSTGKEHYVFGDTDIYMHNGITVKPLARGKVKDRIYSTLVRDKQDKCFVHYDQVNDLIYFCYPSAENAIGFVETIYCNRAAVYDLKSQTWSFVDLPNAAGAAYTNISLSNSTYAGVSSSYLSNANKYSQYEDASPRISAFVGAEDNTNGLSATRIYANDMLVSGLMSGASNTETLKPAFVERLGLDVDETGLPLRSYKQCKAMVPQITTLGGTDAVVVKLGSTDLPFDTAPNYSTTLAFQPDTHHKVDSKAAGRLLAYRVEENNGNFFDFSAADFDVEITSER